MCCCYVALLVKKNSGKYVWSQACEHDLNSHIGSKCNLSVKQKGTVQQAVRAVAAAPLAIDAQVQASLQNFSPGRRVSFDQAAGKRQSASA